MKDFSATLGINESSQFADNWAMAALTNKGISEPITASPIATIEQLDDFTILRVKVEK